MLIELEAIFSSELSTMVFIYGSAAMLVGSMIAVSWLGANGKAIAMPQPISVQS
jgi:hypothetical protein